MKMSEMILGGFQPLNLMANGKQQMDQFYPSFALAISTKSSLSF